MGEQDHRPYLRLTQVSGVKWFKSLLEHPSLCWGDLKEWAKGGCVGKLAGQPWCANFLSNLLPLLEMKSSRVGAASLQHNCSDGESDLVIASPFSGEGALIIVEGDAFITVEPFLAPDALGLGQKVEGRAGDVFTIGRPSGQRVRVKAQAVSKRGKLTLIWLRAKAMNVQH
mmetsp:Transcript_23010/g.58346  ORF Transcript_23010/g.58346 Transcript_23010/m.58346 type:complete len:171 (-) Transcript_23010:777-1289(-)